MFLPNRFHHQLDVAAALRGGRMSRDILPLAAVVITLSFCLACSSWSSSSPDSWTGSYFQNPDRVWAAILETLIDLDYRVAESNREDGTIQTEPAAGEDHAGVLLSINQVMHTMDQVNVYVKPSGGDAGGSIDAAVLRASADQFMAALNKKLQG